MGLTRIHRAVFGAGIVLSFLAALALAGGASISHNTAAAGDCTSSATLDSDEQAFLALLNNHRAQNGLPPLAASYLLSKASQWKSQDMAVNAYFAHDDLTRSWVQRIRDCGYGYNTYLGENIAAGYSSAQAAFDGWRNSPGHNANMLSTAYTAVGIGKAYVAGSPYTWYWTTDFGGVTDTWPAGTPVVATNTPTRTPTRTNTPVAATSTPTRTNTPLPPTATATAPSAPTLSIHVGDLDATTTGKGRWTARVTVHVHDASHRPVAGASVNGRWNGATVSTCVTDSSGRCMVQSPKQSGASVSFAVAGVASSGMSYTATVNHDPEADSNGTTIVIVR